MREGGRSGGANTEGREKQHS